MEELIRNSVRMLDNVLDVTYWPLSKQQDEAMAKRRIGLGFTGLGDALIMLNLRYDTVEAQTMAAKIAQTLRDHAYMASVELAKERGAFPLFDAEKYLEGGFTKRLPEEIREEIRKHGIRNSHLLSIAPTGSITLAFADNASSGIEPVFAPVSLRLVRQADGSKTPFTVHDHAYRLLKAMSGKEEMPDDEFKQELIDTHPAWTWSDRIDAQGHIGMVAAVAPFIDTAISKTINVASEYPFDDFQGIYMHAWKAGLKGITTYRPNDQVDAVLISTDASAIRASKPDFDESDLDRRIKLDVVPQPTLASLRWVKRPKLPNGNPSWTYMIDHPQGYSFAVMVGHVENGEAHPFEVWVNGAEQPRGLGALAKSLSMDLRSNDHGWLKAKLESLMKISGDDAFNLSMPPEGREVRVPSIVAGFARLVHYRVDELGAFKKGPTPVLDALMSTKEPKVGPDGTMSWTVDVMNSATGDDFVMGLKELVLPNGQSRPYSVWLSGEYPKAFDGLCKVLSYDMRVIDPAWIGAKLRQLVDYSEPRGDFLARTPGSEKQANYPSTIAYMARLIIHRFQMLGILDADGFPMEDAGAFERSDMDDHGNVVERAALHKEDGEQNAARTSVGAMEVRPGKACEECGNFAVIKRDGCDFCTACGRTGSCG